jgi:hypothetical protein
MFFKKTKFSYIIFSLDYSFFNLYKTGAPILFRKEKRKYCLMLIRNMLNPIYKRAIRFIKDYARNNKDKKDKQYAITIS